MTTLIQSNSFYYMPEWMFTLYCHFIITIQENLVYRAALQCSWKVIKLKIVMVFYGPASLIAQFPKINETFQPGTQQCPAKFFLDFTQALDTLVFSCYSNIFPISAW